MTDAVCNSYADNALDEFYKATNKLACVATDTSYPENFTQAAEAVYLAFLLLDWATDPAGPGGENLPDVLVFRLKDPDALAQWLIAELTGLMSSCERFTAEEKAHWIKVADYMGPDWIAKFKRIGAFMDKVEAF